MRWGNMVRVLGLLLLSIVVISCNKDDATPKPNLDIEFIDQYIIDNSLTTTTTTEGVYRYVITENSTGNDAGNVFSIYYTLTDIVTGNAIDSHQASDGDPIKIQNNAGAIFPLGLEYGIDGINEGESHGLILTGELGYDNYPTAAVSEDAILLFEIEVVRRESEADIAAAEDLDIKDYILTNELDDTDENPVDEVDSLRNSVYYKRTVIGSGPVPVEGDSIVISYSARFLDDTPFDDLDNLKYKFGSGVLSGLEIGIAEMDQGERATIFIPSADGYGSSAVVIPGSAYDDMVEQFVVPLYSSKVPAYKVIVFDLTLDNVIKL